MSFFENCFTDTQQGSAFPLGGTDAINRNGPSCENAVQKRPQAFLNCQYKNFISAKYAQSNAEGILNRLFPHRAWSSGAGCRAFASVHRRRGRSAGPEGERGVSTPPSLPLDTPLPWTGCGSQRMLRPLSGPCILLATAPTTPPCFCRRQRSSSLQERGCSPLSDPKGVGSSRKY